MCVLVISSHGDMAENKQLILFSDKNLVALYDLIKPVQQKMVDRPFLIFVQACRGTFNSIDNVEDVVFFRRDQTSVQNLTPK